MSDEFSSHNSTKVNSDSDSMINLAKIQGMTRLKWLRSTQLKSVLFGISLVWLIWVLKLSERLSIQTGLAEHLILAALLGIVLGSYIHIAIRYRNAIQARPPGPINGILVPARPLLKEKVLLSFNLGGALLPACYSLFLIYVYELSLPLLAMAILITSLSSYLLSRPVSGIGIALPIFVLPMITAIICYWFFDEYKVVGAYISGTFGVILGADLLRLGDLVRLESSFISIGGAGYLDSIVLNAIFAALLLSYW